MVARLNNAVAHAECPRSTLQLVDAGAMRIDHLADDDVEVIRANSAFSTEWRQYLYVFDAFCGYLVEVVLQDKALRVFRSSRVQHEKVVSVKQVRVVVVHRVRIHRDPAVARLPENRVKHGRGDQLTPDKLPKHVPRANRGQLVWISDEQKLYARLHALHERIGKALIHH